ncbi:MAG: 2-dehydropantoate 2-reductase [Chloroflexota bacterium]
MKLTIVGAGAIGGVCGAYLIQAGHDVTFVDLVEEHVRIINEHGLTIEGIRGTFTVPAKAIHPRDLQGPLETVIIAVKALHTESAARQMLPYLAENGYIVSLQNGLNEETIAGIVGPERTVGAHINWAADYLEPGRILHGGTGSFYVGELDGRITPRVQELARVFSEFTETRTTDNIWGYLWSKHSLASITYCTAMVDADVVDILADEEHRRTVIATVAESIETAARHGIRLQAFDGFEPDLMRPQTAEEWQRAVASIDNILDAEWRQLKRRSGIWRDLAIRKRKTEVDLRVTDLARRGRAVGVDMTLNEKLADLIHEIEEGRRAQSWENIEELGVLARALGRTGEETIAIPTT